MSKEVVVDPNQLGCINLQGVNLEKLQEARRRRAEQARGDLSVPLIHLREGMNGQKLILDGHHRALVALENGELIKGILWEVGDSIPYPLVQINFERARRFHDTAIILGLGTIEQLAAQARCLGY